MNIFGNTLVSGSSGFLEFAYSTNTMIANNDFSTAAIAGLIANVPQQAGYGVLVASNAINQGVSYHAEFQAPNSYTWFFYTNQYLNGTTPVTLFTDPLSTAAHIK